MSSFCKNKNKNIKFFNRQTGVSYFTEISNEEYNPISNEEIHKLVEIAQAGYNSKTETWTEEAEEAKSKIVKSNVRFVTYVVNSLVENTDAIYMDCINNSYFTVVKCIVKYDTKAGKKFVNYMGSAIRNCIFNYLNDHRFSIRIPLGKMCKRRKHRDNLYKSISHFDSLNSDPVNVVFSIDYKSEEKNVFEDLAYHEDPFNSIISSEICFIVRDAINSLKEKEKLIIKRRFFSSECSTLQAISLDMGLTRERIRQIEKESLRKMRRFIKKEKNEISYSAWIRKYYSETW